MHAARSAMWPDEATRIYEDMVSRGIRPDIITLTNLITVLTKTGRRDEARDLFSQGVDMGIFLSGGTLDSLWDKDISKLSYQLVKVAAEFCLDQIIQHFCENDGDRDDISNLTIITGVQKRVVEFGGLGSTAVDEESRQAVAAGVLAERLGVDGNGLSWVDGPGSLVIPAQTLRSFLEKQCPVRDMPPRRRSKGGTHHSGPSSGSGTSSSGGGSSSRKGSRGRRRQASSSPKGRIQVPNSQEGRQS